MRAGRSRARAVALALVLLACDATASPSPSPGEPASVPAASPSPTAVASPSPIAEPVEHRIGVRTVDGVAELFDRATDERWVPRGFNHWQWALTGGYLMDETFRAGTNGLDAAKADLAAMGALGYNAVRIWANACFAAAAGCMGDPAGGLRAEYLENIAEYVRAARDAGIQVMLTFDHLPDDGGYASATSEVCCEEWAGFNLDLTPEGVSDHERFWADFVTGLIEAGTPMDAIWAFQLRNEQFFEADQPPFGLLDTVTTADGERYDLSDPVQVHAMRDSGLRHYVDRMVAAIKAVDPTALVTMGFFPSAEGPVAVPPDARLVDPRPLIDSSLDFLDFHAYPGVGLDWDQAWANSLLAGIDSIPVVLGEFGAFRGAYPDGVDAAAVMVDYQRRACADGLDGYLYWTWSGQDTYTETWGGDEADIARYLSPGELPDACSPAALPHPNLAFGRPVTASAYEDGPEIVGLPSKAIDLSMETWWSSGADAPQWIEVDLGGVTVERVRLVTRQATEGPMQVTLRLLSADGSEVATQVLSQPSSSATSELELEHAFAAPVAGVARLRIDTQRPGWVIWYEIEVFGER
jgi:hypothetical protein